MNIESITKREHCVAYSLLCKPQIQSKSTYNYKQGLQSLELLRVKAEVEPVEWEVNSRHLGVRVKAGTGGMGS